MDNTPTLPTVTSYGRYSSDNYGAHTRKVIDLHGNTFFYSYDTLVAFHSPQTGLVCRENVWGTTTGKHLNWIEPNHKARVDEATFQKKLNALRADLDKKGGK